MTRPTRLAAAVTGVVALLLFTFNDIGLALTNANFCIVLWRIPFAGRVVRLPDWGFAIYTWGSLIGVIAVSLVWGQMVLRACRRRYGTCG